MVLYLQSTLRGEPCETCLEQWCFTARSLSLAVRFGRFWLPDDPRLGLLIAAGEVSTSLYTRKKREETCVSPDSLERFNVVEMVLCVLLGATSHLQQSTAVGGISSELFVFHSLPCRDAGYGVLEACMVCQHNVSFAFQFLWPIRHLAIGCWCRRSCRNLHQPAILHHQRRPWAAWRLGARIDHWIVHNVNFCEFLSDPQQVGKIPGDEPAGGNTGDDSAGP